MIWDPPPGVAFLCSFLGLQLSFYQITGQMNPGVVIPYDPSNSIGFCITSFCITRCLIPNVQDQESTQFLSQVFITKSLHTIYCAKYRNQQEKEMLKSDILFFFFPFHATIIPMYSLILKQYSTACHKHYYVFVLQSN